VKAAGGLAGLLASSPAGPAVPSLVRSYLSCRPARAGPWQQWRC